MKVLIDTHIFLWFINQDPQLSPETKDILESDIDVLLSVASLWEIAIKISIGKLALPKPIQAFLSKQITANQIELLPITLQHLQVVSTLPFRHRDPFDRLIVAQSLVEDIKLASVDEVFSTYGVSLI